MFGDEAAGAGGEMARAGDETTAALPGGEKTSFASRDFPETPG